MPGPRSLLLRNTAVETYAPLLRSVYRMQRIPDPSFAAWKDLDHEEKMLRNARIAHAVHYREMLVAGTGYRVDPRDDNDPRCMVRAKIEHELIREIKHFNNALRLLSRADFVGARFAQIVLVPKTLRLGDGVPRIWAVPRQLKDLPKENFQLVSSKYGEPNGPVRVTRRQYDLHGDAQWVEIKDPTRYIKHVVNDSQEMLGHGRGFREALYATWYAMENLAAAMKAAANRYGQGQIDIAVDGLRQGDTINTAVVAEWLKVVKAMRENGAFVHDKSDELSMLEGSGTGWQILTEAYEVFGRDADRLILGSTLPTGGGDQGVGSLARAEVEKSSTSAIVKASQMQLEQSVSDDLLGLLATVNHPNWVDLGMADCPSGEFRITADMEETPKPADERAKSALEAGLRLREDEAYEAFSFTPPKENERTVVGVIAPAGFGELGMSTASSTGAEQQVEDRAFNGAQVTALADILTRVSTGELAPVAAKIALRTAFPSMTPDRVNQAVDDAFSHAAPAPEPQPAVPAAQPVTEM